MKFLVQVSSLDHLTPTCPLCSKMLTLEHNLSSNSRALSKGCYRWRHDQVLTSIAEVISKQIADTLTLQPGGSSLLRQERSQGANPGTALLGCFPQHQSGWWQLTLRGSWETHRISPRTRWDQTSSWSLRSEDSSAYWSSLCPGKRGWMRHKRRRGPSTRSWWRNGWRSTCMPVEVGSQGVASQHQKFHLKLFRPHKWFIAQ